MLNETEFLKLKEQKLNLAKQKLKDKNDTYAEVFKEYKVFQGFEEFFSHFNGGKNVTVTYLYFKSTKSSPESSPA